ncbi:hypothetical protein QYS48_27190 [Marivirga arenosa]|uniref:Uncharacterized protein n=1 Tax=Marivirga arenosa TaxID=3059076 RepID=A0AA49GEE5_9BACT|nr:hypothetical protein [Marivirga sp. ABR2-2]WKK85514.2 hypothetical protein QYS48_27190 [Marivirga sp. ABR2-2]
MKRKLTMIFILSCSLSFSQTDSNKSLVVTKDQIDSIFIPDKIEIVNKSLDTLAADLIKEDQASSYMWPTLIPAIFAILGILLGNYLNYRNSYSLFQKQKIFDNQRISYSKIMALKNPWIQSIRTNIEAKLLCEFYETRYLLFSQNKEDLDEAKKQNERALGLIKDISEYQMQVFEALGFIQTCFVIDNELQNAIDDIYNFKSITIRTFPRNLKNQNELDELFNNQNKRMIELTDEEYKDKMNKLIDLLRTKFV